MQLNHSYKLISFAFECPSLSSINESLSSFEVDMEAVSPLGLTGFLRIMPRAREYRCLGCARRGGRRRDGLSFVGGVVGA
jgi:hypothetical protein